MITGAAGFIGANFAELMVKKYEGARCTLCGTVSIGALINTITYAVCTHE